MRQRLVHLGIALLWASLTLLPASARGQVATLDEGTFVIERNGKRIGTETFTIRSSGFGENRRVFAQSTLLITAPPPARSTTRAALLTEGPDLSVRVYELSVDGPDPLELKLEARGDRIRTEMTRGPEVQEREFRARTIGEPVVLLDRLLAHQYYFVGRWVREGETPLSVVVPLELTQLDASVTELGTETVTVGRQELEAQHLRMSVGDEIHHVWLDVQNRVLKLEIPSRNLVAIRRAPPSG